MRITQKYLCVKYLAERGIGNWVPAYDVVKFASGRENIIQDADTRLYDIIREGGKFVSNNFTYTLEHRKLGKYAEFRISKREKKQTYLRDFTFA